ncbi:MAG: response regulator [Steroidobacteraceae bacterium]
MITVCLVEDQTLVRQGLQTLLGLVDDIRVVAEAQDGEQALEIVPRIKPDVMLLDMYLPKLSGLEVLTRLQRANALPPTLVLTTFDEDHLVLGSLRLGAKGFLLKDVSLEQLTVAIRTLARGGSLIQPAITERLLRNRHRVQCDFPSSPLPAPLSGRELEILQLMARGYSNHEIADALVIAEGTVKNYVSNVLSKLGVRDRTRAVLKALEAGVL